MAEIVNRIQEFAQRLVDKRKFADDELHLFFVLSVSTLFAGLMHAFLLVVMLFFGVSLLIWVNIFSLLLYTAAFVTLLQQKYYTLTGIVLCVEVIAYTLITSYHLGLGQYSSLYYFVLLFMQLIIPYATAKVRGTVCGVIWLALMGSLFILPFHTPAHSLTLVQSQALSAFNVNLTFFALILIMLISNLSRAVIARNNERRMEEYRNQANTDALTGLHNRRWAELFFQGLLKNEPDGHWCVAMLDIDKFKNINDTLGHPVGDEVLRHLARTLQSSLRKSDTLFRWGGEEFLLVLSSVNLETAMAILDKLRRGIDESTLPIAGTQLHFTVTIGIAPLDLTDVDGSIALSDKNLYYGKNNGRNRVVASEDWVLSNESAQS